MAKIDYESKNGEIYHRKKYLSTVAKMDNGLANDPIVNEILQKSPFDSNAFMLVISQVKNEKNNHIQIHLFVRKKSILRFEMFFNVGSYLFLFVTRGFDKNVFLQNHFWTHI